MAGIGAIIAGTMKAGATIDGIASMAITTTEAVLFVTRDRQRALICPPARYQVMSKRGLSSMGGASIRLLEGLAWLALTASIAASGALAFANAPGQPEPAAGSAEIISESSAAQHDKQHAGIDGLIDHLHAKLKITPEQERLWREVATVMRENARTMSGLVKARAEHAPDATALDDLKSYAAISEAHAVETKRMIPVFQALYDSMSAEQRKAADAEFRGHFHEQAHHAR